MKCAMRLQRFTVSLCFKLQTQTGSSQGAQILEAVQVGYDVRKGRTVTDMSRTDRQRVSEVFHKCGNRSAMWHETIWRVLKKINHIYLGKVYPFHLWRYSPFWVLGSLRRPLHSSLSSDSLLFWKSDAS